MWSICNETFYNKDASWSDYMFAEAIRYFKDRDTTRPAHSEGATGKFVEQGKAWMGVDVASPVSYTHLFFCLLHTFF